MTWQAREKPGVHARSRVDQGGTPWGRTDWRTIDGPETVEKVVSLKLKQSHISLFYWREGGREGFHMNLLGEEGGTGSPHTR